MEMTPTRRHAPGQPADLRDTVLVYYGTAPKAWVDIKLRELLKATGYGRESPIAVQAVYIAPPDDRRKEQLPNLIRPV